MKISSIYNTSVKLENEDYIAVDEKSNRLWIKDGNKIYLSCDKAGDITLDEEFSVNSAGDISRRLDREILPKLDWEKYISQDEKLRLIMNLNILK